MSSNQSTVTVGEYTCGDAFAAARALEHAGITADIRVDADTYRVLVNAEQVDRALVLI